MSNTEDAEFVALLDKIRQERGLDCRQYKTTFLKRRFGVRMRARKVGSYLEYMNLLESDPQEFDELWRCLTINLSYFLRDATVFQALKERVLPALLEDKRQATDRRVRVWSAGCAGGEEPYSVAILFRELLGPVLGEWDITVLGTDFDFGERLSPTTSRLADQAVDILLDLLSARGIAPGAR